MSKLKYTIKKIIKYTVPRKIWSPIRNWKYKLIYPRIYAKQIYPILKKNEKIKNIHDGKRCFVVGNGNSINNMNLLKLKNEYIFTVNQFYFHKQIHQIAPSFYVSMERPNFLIQRFGPDFAYNFFKQADEIYTKAKTIFFLNLEARDYFKQHNLFQDKTVYYFITSNEYSLANKINERDNFDISKPFSLMHGGMYSSLACAAHLGFKKIYLIGCDLDYILQKRDAHFYGDQVKTDIYTASNLKLAYHTYLHLSILENINIFFSKHKITIYNAGIGGLVDTFPRVEYDSLF